MDLYTVPLQIIVADATKPSPLPALTEMAHKLDRMMCVLFEYLNVSLAHHPDDVSPMDRAQRNASLFSLLLVCAMVQGLSCLRKRMFNYMATLAFSLAEAMRKCHSRPCWSISPKYHVIVDFQFKRSTLFCGTCCVNFVCLGFPTLGLTLLYPCRRSSKR